MVMESSSDHEQHKVMRCSTIALLQERFRQLERVKEMREERALLKLLPAESSCYHSYGTRGGSAAMMTDKYYIVEEEEEPASRLFFHSEIIHPTTTCCRKPQQLVDDLSLWPNSEIHHHHHHHRTHTRSNYFGSNINVTTTTTTSKMPNSSITKPWLMMKNAPLTGSNICSIKVDHNMTRSTATANHDVDTSLHL